MSRQFLGPLYECVCVFVRMLTAQLSLSLLPAPDDRCVPPAIRWLLQAGQVCWTVSPVCHCCMYLSPPRSLALTDDVTAERDVRWHHCFINVTDAGCWWRGFAAESEHPQHPSIALATHYTIQNTIATTWKCPGNQKKYCTWWTSSARV